MCVVEQVRGLAFLPRSLTDEDYMIKIRPGVTLTGIGRPKPDARPEEVTVVVPPFRFPTPTSRPSSPPRGPPAPRSEKSSLRSRQQREDLRRHECANGRHVGDERGDDGGESQHTGGDAEPDGGLLGEPSGFSTRSEAGVA